MRPLIFAFKEYCGNEQPDLTMVEYSGSLNLNINKVTGKAAIEDVENLATETMTKSHVEGSDTDYSHANVLMATETRTFTKSESSDTDAEKVSLAEMLITETGTRIHRETSDSDR